MWSIPVSNGLRIGVHTVPTATYLVVAENTTTRVFEQKTGVFKFSLPDEPPERIQTLDVEYASDVIIW